MNDKQLNEYFERLIGKQLNAKLDLTEALSPELKKAKAELKKLYADYQGAKGTDQVEPYRYKWHAQVEKVKELQDKQKDEPNVHPVVKKHLGGIDHEDRSQAEKQMMAGRHPKKVLAGIAHEDRTHAERQIAKHFKIK